MAAGRRSATLLLSDRPLAEATDEALARSLPEGAPHLDDEQRAELRGGLPRQPPWRGLRCRRARGLDAGDLIKSGRTWLRAGVWVCPSRGRNRRLGQIPIHIDDRLRRHGPGRSRRGHAAGAPRGAQAHGRTRDDQGLSRLRREALAGASLSHPNLVSIYDVVTSEEGQLVVVMEYVAGGTLRAALNQRRRLPTEDALPVLEGVAAGLDPSTSGASSTGTSSRRHPARRSRRGEIADLGIAAIPDLRGSPPRVRCWAR